MTKLDAGLMTSLPASDSGSTAVWGSKRINPRPQSCLCLTWSGYPSNDDDDDELNVKERSNCFLYLSAALFCLLLNKISSLLTLRIKKHCYNLINTINVKKHLKGIQAEADATYEKSILNSTMHSLKQEWPTCGELHPDFRR